MGEWVFGTIRDYHRDLFPHSLIRPRELGSGLEELEAQDFRVHGLGFRV